MFGVYMGGIRLYALEKRDDTSYGHDMLLWEKFRDQKDIWHTVNISYTIPSNVEVSVIKLNIGNLRSENSSVHRKFRGGQSSVRIV